MHIVVIYVSNRRVERANPSHEYARALNVGERDLTPSNTIRELAISYKV